MDKVKPIVIFGGGGFAREVLELLRDVNQVREGWEILGFVDEDSNKWGSELNGMPILGGREWLSERSKRPYLALGIGSPVVKRRIYSEWRPLVEGMPALVHPNVVMSEHVELEEGVVVTAGSILTTNIRVGKCAMLNLASTVGHDVVVGAYSTLSPGVNVSGYAEIGEGCDIGTGVKIIPGAKIGQWSIIGAGAVVAKDLPSNCTAVGVPAKVIKERQPGWHLS